MNEVTRVLDARRRGSLIGVASPGVGVEEVHTTDTEEENNEICEERCEVVVDAGPLVVPAFSQRSGTK